MGTVTTSVEHKRDGLNSRIAEITQMDTSETPEGNENTNNTSLLNRETNPPQVLDKHSSVTNYVKESEPQTQAQ